MASAVVTADARHAGDSPCAGVNWTGPAGKEKAVADTRQRKAPRVVATSVDQIPGRQLACRVHHKWPSEDMIDSRAIPRGLAARLVDPEAGMWWVTDLCPRCGKTRYKRYPGRVYDGTGWHYIETREWVRFEQKFSTADAFEANVQRNFTKLFRGQDGDTS